MGIFFITGTLGLCLTNKPCWVASSKFIHLLSAGRSSPTPDYFSWVSSFLLQLNDTCVASSIARQQEKKGKERVRWLGGRLLPPPWRGNYGEESENEQETEAKNPTRDQLFDKIKEILWTCRAHGAVWVNVGKFLLRFGKFTSKLVAMGSDYGQPTQTFILPTQSKVKKNSQWKYIT